MSTPSSPAPAAPPAGAGELTVERRAELGSATARVRLPLADPGTPGVCGRAEADGFFFGGVRATPPVLTPSGYSS